MIAITPRHLQIGLIGLLFLSGCSSRSGQPGLPIGENAPEFKLQDQQGTARTLSEALQSGPVALIFYRSAEW